MFASKCLGECHAVKAALCDLGDPGWGDPWFPHWAFVASCTHSMAHGDFVLLFPWFSCVMGLRHMTHKLSSACVEMILSYHLLPHQSFSPINWDPLCHCCVVVWLFVFCVGCFFVCVCFLFLCGSCLLLFCVSFFVWFSERDKGIGLCIGPLPVYFCGPTARPLRELIN